MNLFVFGLGYSSQATLRRLAPRLTGVTGTVRSLAKAQALQRPGLIMRVCNDAFADPAIESDLARAHALLVSIPPGPSGDPVLPRFGTAIEASPGLGWIGYLSTIGVYGDRGGEWVSEDDEPRPGSERAKARLAVEKGWLALGQRSGKPTTILRLAGIYGPGQNALVNLRDGTARRIDKPGQVFNRIHVSDIASAVEAAQDHRGMGAIYNVTDDEPAPPQDVVAYAADLLGLARPPLMEFDRAAMSPMARSFYSENRRVSNAKAKQDLGWRPSYPTYREGLGALLREERGEGQQG